MAIGQPPAALAPSDRPASAAQAGSQGDLSPSASAANALTSGREPGKSDDHDGQAQLLSMLGRTSTEVGQTFASCRIHEPSPVTVACQSKVGDQAAVGLFTYDMAQRVAKVRVLFVAQPSLKRSLQQARALMRGLGAKPAVAPAAGRAPRRWVIDTAELRGEVLVERQDKLWRAEGVFEDPNFRPAKL